MLEKLPDSVGHALQGRRAGLEKILFNTLDLREGTARLELSSLAFADHGPIPARFTADGDGVSPPLQWRNVPAHATTLALIVEDADSPTGEPLVHAIAVDIDARSDGLAEGEITTAGKSTHANLGRNSFLKQGWLPPDPPPAHGLHAYRVIEHVRTPLFDPRWGADEELLLLEAVELFGFDNWSDIADHVSTKTKTECEAHYNSVYLSAETAPLPDVSKALVHADGVKQETASSSSSSLPSLPSNVDGAAMTDDAAPATTTLSSQKLKGSSSKPKPSHTPLPSKPKPKSGLGHLVGYIPNRGDFDQEYENDAELILADMEFKEEDTRWERELKLKVLEVYCSKLDARSERKKFILERGLLERKERKRGKEEREIWNNMRVFARFHSAEEHEQFIQGLANEARLRRRIERLQQWRVNGVKSLKEGERFEEEKKRREDKKRQALPSVQPLAPSSSKKRTAGEVEGDGGVQGGGKAAKVAAVLPPFPIDSFDQSELLSEKEKQLCCTLQLLPVHYLAIKQRLMQECFVRGFLKEGQARQLIRIDVNKTKELFDFFVSVGWINAQEVTAGAGGSSGGGGRRGRARPPRSMSHPLERKAGREASVQCRNRLRELWRCCTSALYPVTTTPLPLSCAVSDGAPLFCATELTSRRPPSVARVLCCPPLTTTRVEGKPITLTSGFRL